MRIVIYRKVVCVLTSKATRKCCRLTCATQFEATHFYSATLFCFVFVLSHLLRLLPSFVFTRLHQNVFFFPLYYYYISSFSCTEDVNVSNKTAKQNKNEKDGESKRKRTDDKWALQVRQVGRYIAQQVCTHRRIK